MIELMKALSSRGNVLVEYRRKTQRWEAFLHAGNEQVQSQPCKTPEDAVRELFQEVFGVEY